MQAFLEYRETSPDFVLAQENSVKMESFGLTKLCITVFPTGIHDINFYIQPKPENKHSTYDYSPSFAVFSYSYLRIAIYSDRDIYWYMI